MIDYTLVRKNIEVYLTDNFTLCYLQLENTPFPISNPDEFVSIYDITLDTRTPSMGKVGAYTEGFFSIRIFTPLGSGTERSRVIANELANLLSGKMIGNIALKEAKLIPAYDVSEDTPYFQQQLEVAYIVNHGSPILSNC